MRHNYNRFYMQICAAIVTHQSHREFFHAVIFRINIVKLRQGDSASSQQQLGETK